MTFDAIERIAEKEMDRLDKELLNGALTQEEYDTEVKALEDWCIAEAKRIARNTFGGW